MFFGGIGVCFVDMMESESKIFFRLHNPGYLCQLELDDSRCIFKKIILSDDFDRRVSTCSNSANL